MCYSTLQHVSHYNRTNLLVHRPLTTDSWSRWDMLKYWAKLWYREHVLHLLSFQSKAHFWLTLCQCSSAYVSQWVGWHSGAFIPPLQSLSSRVLVLKLLSLLSGEDTLVLVCLHFRVVCLKPVNLKCVKMNPITTGPAFDSALSTTTQLMLYSRMAKTAQLLSEHVSFYYWTYIL